MRKSCALYNKSSLFTLQGEANISLVYQYEYYFVLHFIHVSIHRVPTIDFNCTDTDLFSSLVHFKTLISDCQFHDEK